MKLNILMQQTVCIYSIKTGGTAEVYKLWAVDGICSLFALSISSLCSSPQFLLSLFSFLLSLRYPTLSLSSLFLRRLPSPFALPLSFQFVLSVSPFCLSSCFPVPVLSLFALLPVCPLCSNSLCLSSPFLLPVCPLSSSSLRLSSLCLSSLSVLSLFLLSLSFLPVCPLSVPPFYVCPLCLSSPSVCPLSDPLLSVFPPCLSSLCSSSPDVGQKLFRLANMKLY